MLWHTASIAVVAVPIVFLLNSVLVMKIPRRVPDWLKHLTLYLVIPSGITTYIAGRTIPMVLPFTSLRSLPVDAFKDIDWANIVPHIS